mgnify:CR=1 FL=1
MILDEVIVHITEEDLKKDLGFLAEKEIVGEDALRAYLVRHPDTIERGAELVGIGGPGWLIGKEPDLIFRKSGRYYVVEAKRGGIGTARTQLQLFAKNFESILKKYEPDSSIVPVIVLGVSS